MVLEGLDAVDWDNIYHLQGRATQVPVLLRQIAEALQDETDPYRWNDLREELGYLIDPDNVNIITEVTAYLIPFWIQLLMMDSPAEDRHLLLREIGGAVSGDTIAVQYGEHRREQFEESGGDYDKQLQLGEGYKENVYKTALKYYPLYLTYLNHDEPEFRKSAIVVLRQFRANAPISVPLILERFEKEVDISVKDEMVLGLHHLIVKNTAFTAEQRKAYMPFFEKQVASAGRRSIGLRAFATAGFQAAVVLIRELGADANDEAVELMVQNAIHCQKTDTWDLSLEIACDVLRDVGGERGTQALIKVLDNTRAYPRNLIGDVVHSLLDTAFGKPANEIFGGSWWNETYIGYHTHDHVKHSPPSITKLTTYQKLALEGIINRRKVWKWRTNLFEWYGLPNERKELKALLKKLPVSEEG